MWDTTAQVTLLRPLTTENNSILRNCKRLTQTQTKKLFMPLRFSSRKSSSNEFNFAFSPFPLTSFVLNL